MKTKGGGLRVPYALAVYGKEEIEHVVKLLREHRLQMGAETRLFEERVAALFGKRYGVMVNSGSSANLLALEILNLPPGAEVITPILTFSTTLAPIIQKSLLPVFVDVEPGKYVVDVRQVEEAVSEKTKALLIPWLIGNVSDVARLKQLARKHRLAFIEDSCDTLGATFAGQPTGFYSDITTTSFYGSHMITGAGGGGMIIVNNAHWRDRLKVLRGWGRNSSLFDESENIEKRFKTKVDGVPYDAKFIFGEVGYNMQPLELSAAFANVQLSKLPTFAKAREENFAALFKFFARYEEFFVLPKQDERVKTRWLAFPLTVRPNAPFSRIDLVLHLERHNIQTRPILTGNVLRHPGFRKIPHRLALTSYPVTEEIMRGGFLIGCHQGLEKKHLTKIEEVFTGFLKKYR